MHLCRVHAAARCSVILHHWLRQRTLALLAAPQAAACAAQRCAALLRNPVLIHGLEPTCLRTCSPPSRRFVRALQLLDQNFEYIKVISDCQKRGMTEEANKYSAKLKDNLAVLARQAERQSPSDINQVRSPLRA